MKFPKIIKKIGTKLRNIVRRTDSNRPTPGSTSVARNDGATVPADPPQYSIGGYQALAPDPNEPPQNSPGDHAHTEESAPVPASPASIPSIDPPGFHIAIDAIPPLEAPIAETFRERSPLAEELISGATPTPEPPGVLSESNVEFLARRSYNRTVSLTMRNRLTSQDIEAGVAYFARNYRNPNMPATHELLNREWAMLTPEEQASMLPSQTPTSTIQRAGSSAPPDFHDAINIVRPLAAPIADTFRERSPLADELMTQSEATPTPEPPVVLSDFNVTILAQLYFNGTYPPVMRERLARPEIEERIAFLTRAYNDPMMPNTRASLNQEWARLRPEEQASMLASQTQTSTMQPAGSSAETARQGANPAPEVQVSPSVGPVSATWEPLRRSPASPDVSNGVPADTRPRESSSERRQNRVQERSQR